MKMHYRTVLSSAAVSLLLAAPALAASPVQKIVYQVDAATRCSQAAAGGFDLHQGLSHCDTALGDPAMIHRGALLVDRGIVRTALGDVQGAMADYDAAIAVSPELGDAYINRASANIALKHYDNAKADLARGLQLGAANLAVAYFDRAVIADDEGDAQAAYRDYNQALSLKPDYEAARRELTRFKRVRRTADAG
jgi:tetratricopeptide (TPR) repeat protein